MKFRTGLIVGLVIGFILGARAGRERYEQIRAASNRVIGDERFQQIAKMAEKGSFKARTATGNGMIVASQKVRSAATP